MQIHLLEGEVDTAIRVESRAVSNCMSVGDCAASDAFGVLAGNSRAFHLFKAQKEKGSLARAM